MFETVLVANRGEIAVRVIRTLRRMGVRSVAVYSDEDRGARFVLDADVALHLGAAPASESYLNIDRVLEAAAQSGAQAIHPGYGFLAENAGFAAACASAGITFVGPPEHAVEVMGDKIRAKQAVSAAGVPVVPGRADHGMTDADLAAAADDVGYPVLVKPSAGGGGKGMRLVEARDGIWDALESARREATSSFGDDTLFIERFVAAPRHIEVQVLADAHGSVLHLGERECSLQRRHQKIIEEAPSVLLGAELRERYGALAVATAAAVGYVGAGTVEFIVAGDRPDEPFFMEMNTRLQVEHPVTELITGLDLVEQQLRVAAGELLTFGQGDVRFEGHAVEARVYAEAPARGFVPTGGVPIVVDEPTEEGVRVDSSLRAGVAVGMSYDPMLSKIVAWAPDRELALDKLDRALAATVVFGVGTNIAFLRSLIGHPDVRAGRLDTELVEREVDSLVSTSAPDEVYVAVALARLIELAAQGDSPWDRADGWRSLGSAATSFRLSEGTGAVVSVSVRGGPEAATVRFDDGAELRCSLVPADGDAVLLTLGNRTMRTRLVTVKGHSWLHIDGMTYDVVDAPLTRAGVSESEAGGELVSPMPGSVVALSAVVGATVSKGEVVVVVEAMKMEHSLRSAFDGQVTDVAVRMGDRVAVGQRLVAIRPS